jgi:hypothetical protein
MQLQLSNIKHSDIIPNDWNPNKQNERAFAAEIESITDNGFVQPMTVRKHPTQKSKYQIIDGYHRWLALQKIFDDSKLQTAPLKAIVTTKQIPCVVIDVTEAQAKKLTIILNETRGRAELGELGMLLESIQIDFGDDLIRGLPYSQGQLDDLLSLAEFDWENLEDLGEDEDKAEDASMAYRLVADLTPDTEILWTQALIDNASALPKNEKEASGKMIDILLKSFVNAHEKL